MTGIASARTAGTAMFPLTSSELLGERIFDRRSANQPVPLDMPKAALEVAFLAVVSTNSMSRASNGLFVCIWEGAGEATPTSLTGVFVGGGKIRAEVLVWLDFSTSGR